MKLAIDQESVNIYIDNGEDKEPTNICYWHMDEWKEDSEVVISICNAIQMFYTDKQKLINLIGTMSKIMSETEFIKEHILPYEDDKTKVDYYEGRIDYDNEYLEEVATSKNIKLK